MSQIDLFLAELWFLSKKKSQVLIAKNKPISYILEKNYKIIICYRSRILIFLPTEEWTVFGCFSESVLGHNFPSNEIEGFETWK